jgi:transcription antitermination factor NusG
MTTYSPAKPQRLLSFKRGDRIRVVRGQLSGMNGVIVSVRPDQRIVFQTNELPVGVYVNVPHDLVELCE